MKKWLILPLIVFMLLATASLCAPVVDAGQGAATTVTNEITCDATFVQIDIGLEFNPDGEVTDLYITLQQIGAEPIETEDMDEVSEGLFEKAYTGVLADPISIAISSGSGVALASYLRDGEPKVCVATS